MLQREDRNYRGIIGLGNPGAQYAESRHNAGFLVVDELHRKFRGTLWRKLAKSWVSDIKTGVKTLHLLKPRTYMNLSGDAVLEYTDKFRVQPEDLIVVYDDVDIPTCQIRIRQGGGHGGHNGVRSIIEKLNSSEFCRVRVGIGRPENDKNLVDFVLGSPQNIDETIAFQKTLESAVKAIEMVLFESVKSAMDKFNKKQVSSLE
ncbi:MAG: aminoacyl-tRNA hydrolase [bacterium]